MCCLRRYAEVIDWGGSSHAEARMTVVALVVATAAARGRPSGLAGPVGIAARGGPQRPASIVREDAVREGPVRQGAGSTAGLSLPGLQGGEVTTEPLLTRRGGDEHRRPHIRLGGGRVAGGRVGRPPGRCQWRIPSHLCR